MKKLVLKLTGIFVLVFAMTFISLNFFKNNKTNVSATSNTTPSLEILKNNVSYSDSIYIAYAVACEGLELSEYNVTLLFWETHQDTYLKGTESSSATVKGKTTIDSKQCLVFYSEGLAAKHMTDDLIARAYVVIEGVEYYSEPMKFSVLEYVYKMRESGTLKPNQQKLLDRMLSYGGAAQDNFDYKTDRKADSEYFRINLHGGHHSDGFGHGLYQKGDKVKIKAHKPEDGYKFSHWIDKDGNIVGDKDEIEIEVDGDQDFEAIYKPIETIILKDNLSIDEPFDATTATLSLPDYVTVNNAEDIEETIEVSWDTTTFVPNQIGEQIIYGTLVNSDYVLETPLSIKVNVFPYTFTLDIDNQTYAINKYYGTSSEETIPGTFKGLPVNTIKAYAFNEVTTLTNLVIPTTITSIEQGAIYLCDNITSITVPFVGGSMKDNTYLGYIFGAGSYSDNQAYVPTNLKDVTILEGATKIYFWAFYDCISLKSVTLPNTLEEIWYQSFEKCVSLESIVIPENVKEIGFDAFNNCSSLTSITILSKTLSVESYAFFGCESLQKVYYANTVEDWCNITFTDDYSNPMAYGKNFYMLDENNNYVEIKEITVPDTITEIGTAQFYGFRNVSSISLPNTITTIKSYAFGSCTSLDNFTVTANVSTIGNNSFKECMSLVNINIESNRLTEIGNSAFKNCAFASITIPNTVVSIGSSAFAGCSNLESFIIPTGVTNLSSSLFEGCINLKSVTMPTTLYNIGNYAFSECSSLQSIVLLDSLVSLGSCAFYGCSSLTSVIIPEQITILESHTFAGCSNLLNVVLPSSLTSINNAVFYGCGSLSSITFPNTLTQIGDSSFTSCESLRKVIIPDSVTSLGYSAFASCSNLSDVTISNQMSRIEDNTFTGCPIENIDFKNVTFIGDSVFFGGSLITADLEGVTSIGSYSFFGCPLESVNMPDIVTIGSFAFGSGSAKFKSVVLPETLENIGESAFNSCVFLLVVYNLTTFDIQKGSSEYGAVAKYAKYVYNTLPTEKVSLSSEPYYEVDYYTTTEELNLPNTIKCKTELDEEIELEVYWFKYPFTMYKIGVQTLSGIAFSDTYYLDAPLTIQVNILPYNLNLNTDTNEYSIISYHGEEESVIVPSNINGIPVTTLSNIFASNDSLKEVVLSEGIQKIEDGTFSNCTNLISVSLPCSLTTIGESTFRECTSLTKVEIPANVTSIGDSAFYNCSAEIIWDNTLMTKIEDYAFRNYQGASFVIPNGIKEIGNSSFTYCANLESVVLPTSLEKINEYAFSSCENLEIIYNVSNLELTIGSIDNGYVAYYAKYIHNELPREVSLEKEVAYDATIDTLELPENVTVTYNEEEVTLDVTWDTTTFVVNQIGEQVIYGVLSDDELYDKYNIKRGYIYFTIDVLPYTFSLDEETNQYALIKYYGTEEEIVIPQTFNNAPVISIKDSAFAGCFDVKSILIPEGVTSVGNYAFDYCLNLTSVIIPSSVISIGEYAFDCCISLTSLIIPSSVVTISEYAFYGCQNLTIYCEAASQPEGFAENWNLLSTDVYCNVVFGYTQSEEE